MAYKYDKSPFIEVKAGAFEGYEIIVEHIKDVIKSRAKDKTIIVIDFYPGVRACLTSFKTRPNIV